MPQRNWRESSDVILTWVFSHLGIHGNKFDDQLSRAVSEMIIGSALGILFCLGKRKMETSLRNKYLNH